MPILIDGWNLIRNEASRISDDDGDALRSAETLIGYLDVFQKTHRDPIILVFDSKHEFLELDYENTPKLKIVPAKNADDYIKRYVDKTPDRQRRGLRVVSSDKGVYYYAKDFRATPVKCEEFWSKLYKER